MPKYKCSFKTPTYVEVEVMDDQLKPTKVGTIRIKPSSVMWKKKGAHQFDNVSLDEFVAWITGPHSGAKKTKS